ncbi:DsbA family oxidoreductase [Umezawaea beigongshangensis]|uniref:DsbA family oxidoreductase n=1 Tax=Umezawaea beigongshangensis TaxID=2780383 RepID=UPI0018F14E30|nr:DsbA family oxidoreductase [Umezawaea beigongshangensis]
MQLDVWSDVVCPWCYIGKRKMELALEKWDGDPVEVRWRPYQLDASTPNDGALMSEALAERFGGAERVAEMHAHVGGVAASVGLDYALAGTLRANTFDAHKLVAFASGQGLQGQVQERLFHANFVENRHVGDRAVLEELAAEVGVVGAAQALDDEALGQRLREELALGVALGVRSVPTFVVGNRGVAGAQDPEVILDLLRSA